MICPASADSWCRFQQDRAKGTSLYKPGPGLPDEIISLVKPIYERVSNDALLERCLDGKTRSKPESVVERNDLESPSKGSIYQIGSVEAWRLPYCGPL
jgi:hypothetical protein